jgi:hypothetical protein
MYSPGAFTKWPVERLKRIPLIFERVFAASMQNA